MKNLVKTLNTLLLSLLFVFVLSQAGYTMTPTETTEYIQIPTIQWIELKNEFQVLNSDLTQCKSELQKVRKPSAQLVDELNTAQTLLKKLQQELEQQSNDLTKLCSEADELRTLSQTLKQNIKKERQIHKRQIWQNRFWCLVAGFAIGYAAHK